MGLERGLLIVPVCDIEDVVKSEQLAAPRLLGDGGASRAGREAHVSRRLREVQRNADHDAPPRRRCSANTTPKSRRKRRTSRRGRTTAAATRALPLEGVKVLEFTWVDRRSVGYPLPRRLRRDGDQGREHDAASTRCARSAPFKDHVPGPERSAAYATVNAGKLGMTLNLTRSEGPRGGAQARSLGGRGHRELRARARCASSASTTSRCAR